MKKKYLITALLLIGSIGIAENAKSKPNEKPDPSLKTIFVSQATLDSVKSLKKGMLYPQVRAELIKHGWKPFNYGVIVEDDLLPACIKRTNHLACELPITDNLSLSICFSAVSICSLFPELQAYAGSGVSAANFIFENKHKNKFMVSSRGPFFSQSDREIIFKSGPGSFIDWDEEKQSHKHVNVQLKGK